MCFIWRKSWILHKSQVRTWSTVWFLFMMFLETSVGFGLDPKRGKHDVRNRIKLLKSYSNIWSSKYLQVRPALLFPQHPHAFLGRIIFSRWIQINHYIATHMLVITWPGSSVPNLHPIWDYIFLEQWCVSLCCSKMFLKVS